MNAPKFFLHCASNGEYLRVNGALAVFESEHDLGEFHRLQNYRPQGVPAKAATQQELLKTLHHDCSQGCQSVAVYQAGASAPDFEFLPIESILTDSGSQPV